MEITIRLGTPADLPTITSIIQSAYEPYIPRLNRKPAPMLADFSALIDSSNLYVAVPASPRPNLASPQDAILGLIVLKPQPEHEALQLGNLAVAPQAQGKGIGKKMMDFAEQKAREDGFSKMRLFTNVAMTENRAIYGKRGYKELHEVVEDGLHRVYMELAL